MKNKPSKKIASIEKNRLMILLLSGGVIFFTIFFFRYAVFDPDLFQYRDDGVITMSVGKHIVDYGFVGVSPSGPIIEASSSPLQTFIYASLYAISGIDYVDYSWLQTYITAFSIGILFTLFLSYKPFLALTLTGAAALGLSFLYPFFLWHASGMENALTHLLYFLSIYLLYRMFSGNKINFIFIIPVFLSTIARIESVVHIAFLLLFFSAFWRWEYKNNKAFLFSISVGLLWITFQFGRWVYFGDILPNTAYAQRISVTHHLSRLFFDPYHLYDIFELCKKIFYKQGWWIVFFASPLFFLMTPSRKNIFLLFLITTLFASIFFTPLLFGTARIDIVRTNTQLTLLVVFMICYAVIHTSNIKKCAIALFIFAASSVIAYNVTNMAPYYLGWSTDSMNENRLKFKEIAKENNLFRPTVSNPDLGVMTWHKEFNIIDLGMLGTPEMAKLHNIPARSRYFLEHALPDIIESHDFWIRNIYCVNDSLKSKFQATYELLSTSETEEDICLNLKPQRYWIRRDIKISSYSAERKFLNTLQQNLDVKKIEEEINACQDTKESCAYIARTVYKFIPELRSQHLFDDVFALFTHPVERAQLEGWRNAQAHQHILKAFQFE